MNDCSFVSKNKIKAKIIPLKVLVIVGQWSRISVYKKKYNTAWCTHIADRSIILYLHVSRPNANSINFQTVNKHESKINYHN